MLLIGEILAHAARAAPDAIAATLDDDAITFGEFDAAANRIANGLASLGIGRGDRVLWWGDTSLEALPVFGALAKLGAVFAPLNARASVRRGATRRRVRPGPAASRDGRRIAIRPPSSPTSPASRSWTRSRPARRPHRSHAELDENDPHVIFFTSGSTGRPKGVVLSHRANWLRTYPGATTTTGGGGTVCMFPLFHMAGWTIALGAWQARRPVHFVRVPDAATLCATTARHRAARLYCIPAVWARILEHGVRTLRPREPGRGRHRYVGDATGAAARDQGRVAADRDAGVLRIDRSRPGRRNSATPTSCASRARSACAQAGRRGAARLTRARCACAARSSWTATSTLPTRRPRRSATAGTTPVTSACSTTRATSRSSAGRAT